MVAQALSAYRQFLVFAVVGTLGFVVDAGIVLGLKTGGINLILAQLIAFTVAVSVTWIGNRTWTFRQRSRCHTVTQEWFLYVSANTLGWLVANGVYITLVLAVPLMAHQPVWAVAAGSLSGLLLNYTASRRVVFR